MSNIGELLTFPFNEAESRKNFLIGCLVMLVSFFIPILPLIFAYGYIARIVRKVVDGETPSMPAWDGIDEILTDGLRLYGVKFIISIPLILVILMGMMAYWVALMTVIIQDDPNTMTVLFPIIFLFLGLMMCIALPLGIATSILAYPASIHAVINRKFAAGFQFSEWWSILRINFGGFLLAILITFAIQFLYSIGVQILVFTIILLCLLPLLLPIVMFYMMLIPELLAAQAYREGLLKLSNQAQVTD